MADSVRHIPVQSPVTPKEEGDSREQQGTTSMGMYTEVAVQKLELEIDTLKSYHSESFWSIFMLRLYR